MDEYHTNQDLITPELRAAHAYYNLGVSYANLKQTPEAVEHYQHAIALYAEQKNHHWQNQSLINLATLYCSKEEYEQAIIVQEERKHLAQRITDRQLERDAWYQIGWIYDLGKQYPQAIEQFVQAFAIAVDLADQLQIANAHFMLGKSHAALQHTQEAIEHYQQAIALYSELESHHWHDQSLINLAAIYRSEKNYEQAISTQQQRLGLARQRQDKANEYNALYELGNICDDQQQQQLAIEHFSQALALAIDLEDGNKANTHYMLGKSYGVLKQVSEAIEHYQQAIALYAEQGNHQWQNQSLINLAALYCSISEYEQAIVVQEERKRLAQHITDRQLERDAWYQIGWIYDLKQQYPQAIEQFVEAFAIAVDLADQPQVANAHFMLGKSHAALQHVQEAIEHYQQAIALYSKQGNHYWHDLSLTNLAAIYRSEKNYEQAIATQQQRLVLTQQTSNRLNEQGSLYQIACIHDDQGQHQQAIECFLEALKLAQELENLEKNANAHFMLGKSYAVMQQISEAVEHYKQAIALYGQLENHHWHDKSLEKLANLYRSINDYENAISFQQQRLDLARQIGNQHNEQDSLCDIGNICDDQQQHQDAIGYFLQALSLAKALDVQEKWRVANAHFMLGKSYADLKQVPEAIEHYNQAIALYAKQGNHHWHDKTLKNLADLYQFAVKDYTNATATQQQRLSLAQAIGNRQNEQSAIYNTGRIYQDQQEYAEAIKYFTEALKLAEKINDQWKMSNAYYSLGECYDALQNISEAVKHYQQAETLYIQEGSQKWANYSREKIENLDETKIVTWINRSVSYMESYNYEKAITCIDFALKLDFEHPRAWETHARILFKLKNYSEALESVKQAMELGSDTSSIWNLKGAILVEGFQMYAEALNNFNQALLIDPNNETALENRTLVMSNLGFSQQEIEQTDELLSRFDLKEPQDCKRLAVLRRNQGRYQDALTAYNQAIQFDENDYEALVESGKLLWILNSYKEALESWRRAINLRPSSSEVYTLAGEHLLEAGSSQDALNCFNQALYLNAQDWRAWLGRGKTLSSLEEYAEAIRNYEDATNILFQSLFLSSSSVDYGEALGILNYGKGMAYAKAVKANSFSEVSTDYLQNAKQALYIAFQNFNELGLYNWFLRVCLEIVPVERNLGNKKEAQKIIYQGIEVLNQLVKSAFGKYEQDQLDKEFRELQKWHTDEEVQYRDFFMKLLDGVDEGWSHEQVLRYMEELRDDPYLIQWLNSFARQQLEESWSKPDFDRAYLMIKLGEFNCGELGDVAQKFGHLMVEKTIEEAESTIEKIYHKYQVANYRSALSSYLEGQGYRNNWSYDYRIFQSCRREYREKLEEIEEKLISRYVELPPQSDDYLAWFNTGVELSESENQHPTAFEYRSPGISGNDQLAIVAFHRTLRLTKGQFWEAWTRWGYIALKRPSGDNEPSGIADMGLKFLRRNLAYYQDAQGVLQEIKGDSYLEGVGILYELKGDALYKFDRLKGSMSGMTPLNIDNGMLPNYECWRGWWETAYECYLKALECFTTDRLRERRLGVFKKLVKICRCLGKKDEAFYFWQVGNDLLGRLCQELPLEKQITLIQKFAAFDQYRIDSLAESGQIFESLQLAEKRKFLSLRWLKDEHNKDTLRNLDQQSINLLLNPDTALLYWHISPAAITMFIFKHDHEPRVVFLKNEEIYTAFAEPKAFQMGSVTFPVPNVSEEDFVKGTSGVYDNELVRFEMWMEKWSAWYIEHRYGRKEDLLESSVESDSQDIASNNLWREKLIEQLNELGKVLQVDEITQKYLMDVKQLLLIPHRDLHLLPLEYLFRNKGFAISRLPSLQLALDLEPEALPKLPPIIIEEPGTIIGLDFTKIESAVLAHRYCVPTNNRIRGKQATHQRVLEAIKMPADIFHFSGHGEHNIESPGESALILANEKKLTLRQLLVLPLQKYYLVCLSACETGLTGNNNLIDEFVGLVSAFLARKTSFVLSTLWKVEQISTALLVIDFYEILKEKEKHPALALQEAQEKLCSLTYAQLAEWYCQLSVEIKSSDRGCSEYLKCAASKISKHPDLINSSEPPFAHPYYWAGFTITGKFN